MVGWAQTLDLYRCNIGSRLVVRLIGGLGSETARLHLVRSPDHNEDLMTGQNAPERIARIKALVIIGVALLAAGVSSVMTLWASSFARFMYIEDLGLEGTTAGALAHITPVDRGLLISGGILALLGAAALIAAAVLARHRRAGR